jgi:hypothetical protein
MLGAMTKAATVLVFNGPVGAQPDPREVPEARRLEQALAKIRADAREHARHYRDDTVVPEGGE